MARIDPITPRKTKADVLHRLLALEPEPMCRLLVCTGWSKNDIEGALQELIQANKICQTRKDGGLAYRCVIYPSQGIKSTDIH